MKPPLQIQRFLFLTILGITCTSQAQIPGIIVDGSIVPGLNPPAGVGNCWDFANQVVTKQVMATGVKCDNFRICRPISDCAPLGVVSPNGCSFRKTHKYIFVGDCIDANYPPSQCQSCGPGSQRLCMIYKVFRFKINGTCDTPCNEWVLHFDGTCTTGPVIDP